jgi:hypothetical protein
MLIDKTYFKGIISLQFSEDSDDAATILSEFEYLENEYLDWALGFPLRKLFLEALDEDSPAQKWLDLRDGKDFTVTNRDGDDVTIRWNGLINSDKVSFLSYFLFAEYANFHNIRNTTTGSIVSKNENSEIVYPKKIINAAWNEGIKLYGTRIDDANLKYQYFLKPSKREIIKKQWNQKSYDYYKEVLKGTLYNYIHTMNEENGDDYYPYWEFTDLQYKNMFGI